MLKINYFSDPCLIAFLVNIIPNICTSKVLSPIEPQENSQKSKVFYHGCVNVDRRPETRTVFPIVGESSWQALCSDGELVVSDDEVDIWDDANEEEDEEESEQEDDQMLENSAHSCTSPQCKVCLVISVNAFFVFKYYSS